MPAQATIEPVAVESVAAAAAPESVELAVHAFAAEPESVATTADIDTAADAAALQPAPATSEPIMVEAMAGDAASESGEVEVHAGAAEPESVATTADIDFAADAAALQPAPATSEPIMVEAMAGDAASESGELEVHAGAAEPEPMATTADIDFAADAAALEPAHAMIEPVAVEAMAVDAASESVELEVSALDTEPAPVAATADIDAVAAATARWPVKERSERVPVEPAAVTMTPAVEPEVSVVDAESASMAETAEVGTVAADAARRADEVTIEPAGLFRSGRGGAGYRTLHDRRRGGDGPGSAAAGSARPRAGRRGVRSPREGKAAGRGNHHVVGQCDDSAIPHDRCSRRDRSRAGQRNGAQGSADPEASEPQAPEPRRLHRCGRCGHQSRHPGTCAISTVTDLLPCPVCNAASARPRRTRRALVAAAVAGLAIVPALWWVDAIPRPSDRMAQVLSDLRESVDAGIGRLRSTEDGTGAGSAPASSPVEAPPAPSMSGSAESQPTPMNQVAPGASQTARVDTEAPPPQAPAPSAASPEAPTAPSPSAGQSERAPSSPPAAVRVPPGEAGDAATFAAA